MKAVIYARYSSDSQREESIEGQLRECTAFAEKNGITILRHYIDRAYSAKTDNRPEFQNMIKDSNKKLFDMVLVWKLDRFARNRYDSARYKAQLKKNGVKVVSATEVISEGAEGIILESVLEGYAEYYSADLSEKVIRGMTDNALKCKYNGGTLPIGYMIDDEQHFQIDPLTAPFVLDVFKKYDKGATMTELRDWLNECGIKNTRGQSMKYNSIQHMLYGRSFDLHSHLLTKIYIFCKIKQSPVCKSISKGKRRKGEVIMLKKTALFLMCLMIFALILCACHAQPEENDEILASNPTETTETAQATEATTVPTEPETTQTTEPTQPEPETTPKPTEPEKQTTPNTFAPKPEKEEEPPKPTKPKQEESAKPTEPKQEDTPMPDWKKAYLDFLETVADEHESYALVYIDGDDIPELYLRGVCEAGGDGICTYKNGEVIEERLARIDGGSYIPRSGLLINTNGNMGYYTTEVYKLTSKGFSVIWSGLEIADYVELENGEYEEVSQFSTGGKTVSEEEYYAAIEAVFNTSKAVSFSRNAVSYDAIRKQIKNH